MTKLERNAMKSIKKQYFKDILTSFPIALICMCGFILVVIGMLTTEVEMGFGGIIAILSFLVMGLLCGKISWDSFHYFNNPKECDICRIYGDIDEVIDKINATYCFEDQAMIIAQNYIISKHDYRDLFSYDDILGIYIQQHKTNFVTDYYSLIISNKYNKTSIFHYSPENKVMMEETFMRLIPKCKNARFGYTNETLQYIKDNIVPIPNTNE